MHGLVDDAPGGPSVDAHDLRHALRIINSAPNLLNPAGQISLQALGNVLEAKLPDTPSYPQSVHRVVSINLTRELNHTMLPPKIWRLMRGIIVK